MTQTITEYIITQYIEELDMARYPEKKPTEADVEISVMRDHGYFLLMKDIDADSAHDVIKWIIEENLVKRGKKKSLTLIIHSEGGDLQAGFAIIDTMQGSAIPIRTIGIGMVASAALCIFMSGEPGNRILTPNTSILSHQYSWHSDGKEHELFAAMKEFNLTRDRMLAHYRHCTGLPDDKIREFLLPPQDMWLSAEEALELGICDLIKETY